MPDRGLVHVGAEDVIDMLSPNRSTEFWIWTSEYSRQNSNRDFYSL